VEPAADRRLDHGRPRRRPGRRPLGGATWVAHGSPPAFAVFLPLWFTVQYLGHVFAVMADRCKWCAIGTGADDDGAVLPTLADERLRARGAETVATTSASPG